jgi:hypothetical protein
MMCSALAIACASWGNPSTTVEVFAVEGQPYIGYIEIFNAESIGIESQDMLFLSSDEFGLISIQMFFTDNDMCSQKCPDSYSVYGKSDGILILPYEIEVDENWQGRMYIYEGSIS